ncbi:MAG: AAA family ATPase [Candidatus Eisenbacteria bacterium]|nr:AAA family ATPase [Candidatus Eisenbacteria bacterium]
MSPDLDPLEEAREIRAAMAALRAQAETLSPTVLEIALAPLRQRLARLEGAEDSPWLRQVSVLFVDIVESTRLVRALDVEESHRVLDGALRRFSEIVRAQGGSVLRFTGDGLKAAFGVPEPAEDDAERAVAAGLAILEAAVVHAEEVRRAHGFEGFAVRAGLHTGPVAIGSGVEESQTLVGATVHLAARLEQAAVPGSMRVSRDTYRLLRGGVEAIVLPPLRVKGLDAPLESYRVLRLLSAGERGAGRGTSSHRAAMVGRSRELATLHAAVEAVVAHKRARAVTVIGDAGLGKSRLCETFLEEQRGRGTRVLLATALPRTEGQTFSLLRELVLRSLDARGEDGPLSLELALESEYAQSLLADADGTHGQGSDPAALAHLLGYALGIGFGDSPHVRPLRAERSLLRQRAFHAATLWLRNYTAGSPLLLVLEDLHWADDASLDLLDLWLLANADLPLCVVAFARPSLLERRPGWSSRRDAAFTLELSPLREAESRELAARVLAQTTQVPEETLTQLLARAQGNPYYLEELIGMLVDHREFAEEEREQGSRSGGPLLPRLPVTLTGALQARLSRLDGEARRSLQQASILGPRFSEVDLGAIDARAAGLLPALQERGLVYADGEGKWRFHHQLLQEVAYDSLLKRERMAWHARVAEHTAGAAERGEATASWVADHYDRAGNADAAGHYYVLALEDAGRMGLEEQHRLATRALALVSESDEQLRLRLHRIVMRCHLEMRRPELAIPHVEAARAIAERRDDDGLRAELAVELAIFREPAPDPAGAASVVELARRAEARGQSAPLAAAYAIAAWALCTHGRAEEAYAVARQALAAAQAEGVLPPSQAVTSAAIAAWKLGDLSAGLAYVQTGLENDRLRGNRAGELSSYCNLAGMARTLGDIETWRQAVDVGFRLSRQLGNRHSEPLLRVRRGQLALFEGQVELALAEMQAALDLLPASDRWFRITALLGRGHALLAAHDVEAAESSFAEARIDAGKDAGMQAEALEGLVRTALARGDTDRALEHARDLRSAIDAPEPGDITERPAQLLAIFDALTASGDPAAASVLAEARAELMRQADAIGDAAARERFLRVVPHNARILRKAAAGL